MNSGAERLRWAREALRIHCPHASGDCFADGHLGVNAIPLHRLFLVPPASPADGGRVDDIAGRRSLPLTPGSVLLLPAGRTYRFRFAPGLLLVGFHFQLEVFAGQDLLGDAVRWQRAVGDGATLTAAWQAAQGRSLADWLELEGILRRELAHMIDLSWTGIERACQARRRWGDALADLERLGARRAVAACAKRQGMTREGFSRAFRRDLGLSPSAWQTRRLAERASEMLLYTDQTLDGIAAALGFCDGFTVSRLVHRVTGRRPSELRAVLRRQPAPEA